MAYPGDEFGDAGTQADSGAATPMRPELPDASPVTPAEECGVLTATIRDFRRSHPDFESFWGDRVSAGIIAPTLGDDDKPVYDCGEPCISSNGQPQVTSRETFDQWYRDVEGINQTFEHEIILERDGPGRYVYESRAFFPIDEQGYGHEEARDSLGDLHNFHFTTEIHTRFLYRGGETFTFVGDDDLWLFINGRLAIDLGGLHAPETGTIDLDARAEELGITPGGSYRMDIFHAERHTFDSNFRIETSIACFELI